MVYFGRSWGSYDFIFSHIVWLPWLSIFQTPQTAHDQCGCNRVILHRLHPSTLPETIYSSSRPPKSLKSIRHANFLFFIYILFFQMTKRKNNPLHPKGKQKKVKILVTRYISDEKSRPSNDETKNNPPSTQKKRRNYYLTSFFDAVYFPSKKSQGKERKLHLMTWMG